MIGMWSAYAQQYLLVLCLVTSLAFALPITFAPLAWARVMRWRIPADTDLALYFGRCLGLFVLIVEILMLRAGLTGIALVTTFEVLCLVATFMVAVHVVGAIQKVQPWTETAEIGMYSAMLLLTLLFFPPG